MTIIERAIKIVARRAAKLPVEPGYWIGNADDEHFCSDCAEKRVAELNAAHPGTAYSVDGTGDAEEHDWPIYCAACNVRLKGVTAPEDELDYFDSIGYSDSRDRLSLQLAENCYSLKRIFESNVPPDSPLYPRIIALAQRVVNRAAGVKKRAKARKAKQ